jgi:Na+-driven multidrug efflux pump
MIGFSGWVFIGALADLLKRQGVNVLINKSFGPAVNAANAVGATMSSHCLTLSSSIIGAFWPAVINAYGAGDLSKARTMAIRMTKLSVFFVILFAIPLCLEVDEVLRLWLKNPPEFSGGLCVFVLITEVIDKLSVGPMILVNANGRMAAYQCVVGGIALMVVPVAIIFVMLGFNVYYTGLAAALVMLFQSVARALFARWLVGFSVTKWIKDIILPLIGVVLCTLAVGSVPRLTLNPGFIRIIVTTAASLCAMLPLTWFILFGRAERDMIVEKVVVLLRKCCRT